MRASEALLAWARGYDPALRLNATVEHDGDRSLVTSAATTLDRYIDGSRDVEMSFSLVLVAPWSEGPDGLNADALAEGEAWLSWVASHPTVGGLEDSEVRPYDEEPVLALVTADGLSAKYQFQARCAYHKEKEG